MVHDGPKTPLLQSDRARGFVFPESRENRYHKIMVFKAEIRKKMEVPINATIGTFSVIVLCQRAVAQKGFAA